MQLFNNDCLKVIADMPCESVDLVVTDCPYHIVSGSCSTIGKYAQTGGVFRKTPKGNYYTNTKHISLAGILNDADPTTYTKQGKLFKHNEIKFSEWLPEVYRVLKNNSHCYVMINARNLKDLQVEAEKAGFVFQQLLVWDKGNLTPNKYYMNAYELILMLRKGKAKNINNMGASNILRVPNITHTKRHPTEKPAELMQVMIENSSNANDIVLDPFMGVGGVGVACKNTGREFIGIEIDEKYFRIAQERLEPRDEPRQLSIEDFF